MRLTVITRRGLADLIRERYGVRAALFMFGTLLIANIGTLVTELSAVKTTSGMFGIPPIPAVIVDRDHCICIDHAGQLQDHAIDHAGGLSVLPGLYLFGDEGQTRLGTGALESDLSAWSGIYVHLYRKDYLIIGMGVLGTTITPWGQFFISSFAYDKKIEKGKVVLVATRNLLGRIPDGFLFVLYDRGHCCDPVCQSYRSGFG